MEYLEEMNQNAHNTAAEILQRVMVILKNRFVRNITITLSPGSWHEIIASILLSSETDSREVKADMQVQWTLDFQELVAKHLRRQLHDKGFIPNEHEIRDKETILAFELHDPEN